MEGYQFSYCVQEEMGIAPLGHRQGLRMAISNLTTFNRETHGGSPPHHPYGRGRPQSAPGPQGYSSDGGPGSPERGLKELHALKALDLRDHLLREMEKAQARAAHREA